MARSFEIDLNETEIHDFLTNPHGPVSVRILGRAGAIVTQGARIRAPILTGRLFNSIHDELGVDAVSAYARISAEWYDEFLEKPARQLHRPRRTLRNALRAIPKLL